MNKNEKIMLETVTKQRIKVNINGKSIVHPEAPGSTWKHLEASDGHYLINVP